MKIKRKDITIDQYKMWLNHNCNRQCDTNPHRCPFVFFPCQIDDEDCWIYNKEKINGNKLVAKAKEIFDKWLEEEIEIYGYREPTDDEKEKIKFYLDSLGYPLKARWIDIEKDEENNNRLVITGFVDETKQIKEKKITITSCLHIYIPLKGDEFDCIPKDDVFGSLKELGIEWGEE